MNRTAAPCETAADSDTPHLTIAETLKLLHPVNRWMTAILSGLLPTGRMLTFDL